MQYRKLGKLGIDVSALGFGTMRLPTLGSETEVDIVVHGYNKEVKAFLQRIG